VGKPQPEVDPFRDELAHLRKALGRRIRELRNLKGWSQEDLAAHAYIHRTFAGSLERGEKNVSFHGLVLLARSFGTTLADLLAGLEAGEFGKGIGKAHGNYGSLDRKKVLNEAVALERTARTLREIALEQNRPQTARKGRKKATKT